MNMRFLKGPVFFTAMMLAAPAMSSTVVVNGDEWTLSDFGFSEAGSANVSAFVSNLVAEFGTTLHAYSTNFGFTQPALANAISAAGGTLTTGLGITFDLPTLLTYDGIFLGGNYLSAAEESILSSYVAGGGNVYIAAGTGAGGAAFEAAQWNDFLTEFGIELGSTYTGPSGVIPVSSSDPLFSGVDQIYSAGANFFVSGDVVCCGPDAGLVAVWRSSDTPPPDVIPLPASGFILLSGLIGLIALRRSGV